MPTCRVHRAALLAVFASLAFGVFTSLLPIGISGKNPRLGYSADGGTYWDLAGNLTTRHEFANSPGLGLDLLARLPDFKFEMQRLPGYPLLLAGVRSIAPSAGPRSWLIEVLNLCLVFVNAFFILSLLGRDLLDGSGGERCPVWAGALVALFLPFLLYSNGINSDFLAATLVAGFCHAHLSSGKWRYASPFFATWSVMTRIGSLAFILPFLILNVVRKPRGLSQVRMALLVLLPTALCLSAWSYRNYRLSGYFQPEFMSGLVLQQNYLVSMENEPPLEGFGDFRRWNSEEYRARRFQEIAASKGPYAAVGQIDSELKSATKALILEHPLHALKSFGLNLVALFLRDYYVFLPDRIQPSSWSYPVKIASTCIFYVAPALLFLGGLSWFLLRRECTTRSILGTSGLCYAVVTASTYGLNARYLLPVEFTIILVSMHGLIALRRRGLATALISWSKGRIRTRIP